jgi:hypothetical protein
MIGGLPAPSQPQSTAPGSGKRFRTAEFRALREEIVKRLELESQVIYLLLFSAGTILAVGVQGLTGSRGSGNSAAALVTSVLFVFPIVAFFLAAIWAQHDLRIGQIRAYIRDKIETYQSGWESYRNDQKVTATVLGIRLGTLGARGAFLSAQVASLALAVSYFTFALDWNFLVGASVVQEGLAIFDVFVIGATILLVRRRRN